MSKTTPLINNFTGGELDPKLDVRVNLDKYANGCRTLQNVIPFVEGGATRAPGTVFAGLAKEYSRRCILRPFVFNSDQAYQLEIGHGYARIWWMDGSQIAVDTSMENYDPAASHFKGRYVKIGGYDRFEWAGGKTLYIARPHGYEDTVPISITANATDDLAASDSSGTLLIKLANTTASKNAANLIQAAIRAVGTVGGFSVTGFTATENTLYAAGRPITAPGSQIYTGDLGRIYQCLSAQAVSATNTGYFPSSDISAWSRVYEGDRVEIPLPYQEDDLALLQVSPQSADVIYMLHPSYPPAKLMRRSHIQWEYNVPGFVGGEGKVISKITQANPAAVTCSNHGLITGDTILIDGVTGMTEVNNAQFVVTVVNPMLFTLDGVNSTGFSAYIGGGYAAKVGGIFNTPGQYPACGTFYEQRLMLAGMTSDPLTVHGSRCSDFENFLQIPSVEDTAVQYRIVSSKVDIIEWMSGQDQLMIGTAGGIWRLTGGGIDQPLTQLSVSAKKQNPTGAARIEPVQAADALLWVTASGRVVRALLYALEREKWVAPDMTRVARHITKSTSEALSGIREIAFQEEPIPVLWALRNDGVLLGMVYEADEQVYPWFTLETEGTIESISVLSVAGSVSRLWMVVARAIGPGAELKRSVEYSAPFTLYDKADAFFVHCGATRTPSGLTVSDLEYLNNHSVVANVDGKAQGPFPVIDGQITLTETGDVAHVGLSYQSIVETMKLHPGTPTGTSRGKPQRVSGITACFFETGRGVQIGEDTSHMRSVDELVDGELNTIDITQPFDGDWSRRGGVIRITQSNAMPMTVLGLVPEVTVNEP